MVPEKRLHKNPRSKLSQGRGPIKWRCEVRNSILNFGLPKTNIRLRTNVGLGDICHSRYLAVRHICHVLAGRFALVHQPCLELRFPASSTSNHITNPDQHTRLAKTFALASNDGTRTAQVDGPALVPHIFPAIFRVLENPIHQPLQMCHRHQHCRHMARAVANRTRRKCRCWWSDSFMNVMVPYRLGDIPVATRCTLHIFLAVSHLVPLAIVCYRFRTDIGHRFDPHTHTNRPCFTTHKSQVLHCDVLVCRLGEVGAAPA